MTSPILAQGVDMLEKADPDGIVLQEANLILQENRVLGTVPLPRMTGQTYGDWILSFTGHEDMRPGDDISYETIEMMIKSGPVWFAMEMKRSAVYRVFSSGRYIVESPDTELAEVAEASLKKIMQKMADDFTYSAFVYGSSFQEKVWQHANKYELGLSKSRGSSTSFVIPQVPKSVNPKTIKYIRRLGGKTFDGFVQRSRTGLENDIVVPVESALIIPLNGRFRNLWGTSFLKTIYPIWLWYEIILRAMARYMERMATPVAVGKGPMQGTVRISDGSGSSKTVEAMDLMLSVAGNVAKSNAVAIPSDVDPETNVPLFDLTYLTAEERSQPFISVLEFLSQEIIRAGLSADRALSQSSGGIGSFNIGEVHAKASSLTTEMILMQFMHFLNLYFMPDFSLYNRGLNGPPIWMRNQSADIEERETLIKLINIAGNAPAGQEFLWAIDYRALGEMSNVPMLSEEESDALKQKIMDESLNKQEQQQKLMQKFGKNQEGNTQRGGLPPKTPQEEAAKKGEPLKKTPDTQQKDKTLEKLTEYVINGGQLPLVLSLDEINYLRGI